MIADVDGRDKPGRDGDGAFISRHLLRSDRDSCRAARAISDAGDARGDVGAFLAHHGARRRFELRPALLRQFALARFEARLEGFNERLFLGVEEMTDLRSLPFLKRRFLPRLRLRGPYGRIPSH